MGRLWGGASADKESATAKGGAQRAPLLGSIHAAKRGLAGAKRVGLANHLSEMVDALTGAMSTAI